MRPGSLTDPTVLTLLMNVLLLGVLIALRDRDVTILTPTALAAPPGPRQEAAILRARDGKILPQRDLEAWAWNLDCGTASARPSTA